MYFRKRVNYNDAGIASGVYVGTVPAGAIITSTDLTSRWSTPRSMPEPTTASRWAATRPRVTTTSCRPATNNTGVMTTGIAPSGSSLGSLAADRDIYVMYAQTGNAANAGSRPTSSSTTPSTTISSRPSLPQLGGRQSRACRQFSPAVNGGQHARAGAVADELDQGDLTSEIQNAIQDSIGVWERRYFYFNAGPLQFSFNTVRTQEYYTATDQPQIPTSPHIQTLTGTFYGWRRQLWKRDWATIDNLLMACHQLRPARGLGLCRRADQALSDPRQCLPDRMLRGFRG